MQTPYEPYKDQIGVRLSYLLADADKRRADSLAVIGYEAFKKRAARNRGLKLRTAGGQGNEVLLSWENLPYEWQVQLTDKFGDPKKAVQKNALAKHYARDPKAADFYANYLLPDGKGLKKEKVQEYTTNASVLNAVMAARQHRKSFCKALGGNAVGQWKELRRIVEDFREEVEHTLSLSRLERTVADYKKQGYEILISGRIGNQNTAKIKTGEQLALLEELVRFHNNFDNEQIAKLYNTTATIVGWKTITAATVGNYREELDLHTYSGRRGETNFRNSRAMQVKRRAPSFPLYYWTLDGWDVELLYQKNGLNASGHSVTTYHNRLTAVVVLDPCCKYPVGYAIGSHETPELIKEAMRNAANHTKELFQNRYKPLQLQSDRYAIKTLTPLYEAMTKHFTPARVKNAKAKVVERYFLEINKKYCQTQQNWSGFGITSSKESQPNADYLNKIRHQFPDEQGCRYQIVHMLEMERAAKQAEYVSKWQQMPAEDCLPLSNAEYLNLFGETTGFTNRLEGRGLYPTILGEKRTYDSFDVRFHELRHTDWLVKYDPDDLTNVLVVDAEARSGKLVNELNTVRFMLEAKYEQPMALVERQDGDAEQLKRIKDWNASLEQGIVERGTRNRETLDELFNNNPALDGTLTKLILTDSAGQHKDQRNSQRIQQKAAALGAKQERKQAKQEIDQGQAMRAAYIDAKLDFTDFIDL